MYSQNIHEVAFIKAFIVKEKQERLLALVQNKKSRKKFCLLLAHNIEINTKFTHPLKKEGDNGGQVHGLLKKHGAPDICHIICENSKYDNKEMQLKEALHELFTTDFGCIISCIPGKLAFYQGEDAFSRVLLISH